MSLHVRSTFYSSRAPAGSSLTLRRSICQRNSWRPLQITRSMMDLIHSTHDIDESFWDLPSCFYTRNLDLEEVHCVPYTETRRENVIGIF